MAVGLLLVTHGRLGDELLAIASTILGKPPLPCAAVGVAQDRDPEQTRAEIGARLSQAQRELSDVLTQLESPELAADTTSPARARS